MDLIAHRWNRRPRAVWVDAGIVVGEQDPQRSAAH